MVKSELVHMLNEKFPDLQQEDLELALNCILGQMTDALVNGKRIEIRGFGSFDLRHRPPRIGRNPKTGETLKLAAKVNTHFKPGKEMQGVAIFAKDCFGHPSPSNRQKLNATNYCLRRPSRPASLD